MGNKFGKIRESIDALRDQETKISRAKLKIQHQCPHNVDGNTDRCISVIRNGDGAVMKCEKCGAIITMTPPKSSEFSNACSVIENGINYIKMQERESNPQDKEIIDKCAQTLDLLTAVAKMYDNLEHNGGKKKKDKAENRRVAFSLASRSLLD